MKRLGLWVLILTMAAGLTGMVSSVAWAVSFDGNTYFKLVNRSSTLYLDNLKAESNGANVVQAANKTEYSQQWQLQSIGSGYYKLRCRDNGYYLDGMGRTVNGALVCQYSSSNNYNQQWQIVDNGGGYYKVINRATGKCLDTGGNTADGTTLQMWESGYSWNQQWQIVDASTMYSAYLLTYFMSSNSAVYFAYSRDALNWTVLNNGSPVLTSSIGTKKIRDPFCMRDKAGRFHLMGTNNWSSPSIVMYDSDDLITWTNERLCNIAPSTATFAWAPECRYDSSVGKYRIYFATNPASGTHKMYTTLTTDFTNFSSAEAYYDPGTGLYAIDGTIVPYQKQQFMFFKYSDPGPVGVGIQRVKANSLSGPWSNRTGPFTDNNVEGPAVFKDIAQNKWYLYGDYYTSGYWVCYTTEDLSGTWSKIASGSFAIPSGARHGNVMPLTEKELTKLLVKWGE